MRNFLLLLSILFTFSAYAHNTGSISGTVSDAKSEMPIIGANIQIANSLIATNTDLFGKFELKNIQIGTYELVFSFLGYQTIVRKVEVKENATTTLKIELDESVIGDRKSVV